MVNMRTAASVVPKVVPITTFVPTTLTAMYQPAVGVGAEVISMSLVNQDSTSAQPVSLFIVPSGQPAPSGTNGLNCKVPNVSIPIGGSIELGQMMIGDQDAVWAVATNPNKVALIITINEFSNATGAILSGVQLDAVGVGGSGTAGAATGSNKIGTAPNRRLVAAMLCAYTVGAGAGWASYTGGGPTLSCTDGPMVRKASVDINSGSGIIGSIHLFTFDNPLSGSNQALSAACAFAGSTFNVILGSKSYSGVDLTAPLGNVSVGPVGAAVMSLPYTMAAGNVPILAAGSYLPLLGLDMSCIRHDGVTSGFTIPQYMMMADLFGASALTASATNSTQHGAVGIVLKPA